MHISFTRFAIRPTVIPDGKWRGSRVTVEFGNNDDYLRMTAVELYEFTVEMLRVLTPELRAAAVRQASEPARTDSDICEHDLERDAGFG